jgi:hypothetical protein
MKASTIFRRLASFFGFSSVVDSAISTRSIGGELLEVERDQHLADRLGADERR